MTPSPGAPSPPRASTLGGRIVTAGEVSRQALARILGLEHRSGGPGEPLAVTGVAWLDHALEVAVDSGSGEPVVVRIEARTPESRGLVLTRHLNLFIRGHQAPEPLVRQVARCAARTLASWTMEDLARLIESDPEAGKPGLPMPPATDESRRPRSLLDTWGAEDSYADFFAGGELSRSQLDSVDFSRLFRFIQHSDVECTQVSPSNAAPIVGLVSFPWSERLRQPLGALSRRRGDPQAEQGEADGMLTTDLDENDVILGNPDKLRQVLQHALAHPGAGARPLFVSNTCVPTVIGEDVESVVKQAEARSGQRICYLTVSRRSMTVVFKELLVDRRLEAERRRKDPPPRTVNLIGFSSTPAVTELEALLQQAGIGVNVRFLPDVTPELVDRLPDAALNVILPNRTWQHFYDQLTFDSTTPHLAPTAPYGLQGTHRWLAEIAAALEHRSVCVTETGDADAAFERHAAPWRGQWDELRARAGGHRLGFVVRDEETYYLTTPGTTWGVPLLAMLEEMGFGLDVLVRVSDPVTARNNARAVRQMFVEPGRHTIRAFDSQAFLRHRLKESPSDAFFSCQLFDWRLTEAGKASFSVQHLEPGVTGALRTLRRLLAVCRTSYYQRYARHLARTAEGLRDPRP